jgi:hypothetical protein
VADKTSTGRAPSKKKAPAKKKKAPAKKAPAKRKAPAKKKKAPAKKKAPTDRRAPLTRWGRRKRARADAVPTAEIALRAPDDRRGLIPRHDLNRPHIRLGFAWFVVILASAVTGAIGVSVVYGLAAGLAALQTVKAWDRAGRPPNRMVAGLAAAGLPVSAAMFDRGLGLAVLVATVATVVLSPGLGPSKLAGGATTVRCWLFVGLAAASPVVIYTLDVSAYVALVLLVSAFEAGDFLFGAGSRTPIVGTLVGMVAVGVISFSISVTPLFVFDGADVFVFAVVTALLAPVGQILASFILPDGRALASGVRRLDSLLLVGPAWVLMLWSYPWG